RRRYLKAKCLGGFEIDQQLVLGRRLHGKVGWLLTFQNTVNVLGRAAVRINLIRSIGDESSVSDPHSAGKYRGQSISCSQVNDQAAQASERNNRQLPLFSMSRTR